MINIIVKFEGFSLKAYKCPAGKWTIGYGSTIHLDGSPVLEGNIITKKEAIKLLFVHVDKRIISKLPDDLVDKLTHNQLSAVVSLVYNIGIGAFLRSNLLRAIMSDDYKSIVKNWDWFSATVDGKKTVLKGLVRRRLEESNLFIQDI